MKNKKEILQKYNLNPRQIDNYFKLAVTEQVSFINNCFSIGLTDKEIQIILGCSWTKITQDIRKLYRKDKLNNKYIKKDIEDIKGDTAMIKLQEEIENLKGEIDVIKKQLSNTTSSHKILEDVELNLCSKTILKQYKIDVDVAQNFDTFAENFGILNKQVLVSMALKQFLDKYNDDLEQ